jgi:hypothetical protein
MPTDAGRWFKDSEQIPHYPAEHADADPSKRHRTLLLAIGGALAAIVVVLAIVMIVGNGKPTAAANGGSASSTVTAGGAPPFAVAQDPHPAAATGSGSATDVAMAAPNQGSAGSAEPPKSGCTVEINSAPPGAQIVSDGNAALGTTPATIDLPCGTDTKIWLKKSRYVSVAKVITPTPEGTKLDVIKLGRAMFSVKVTSAPSGATITVGGRSAGVTPSTIKLNAFETTHVTLTKDGFAPETEPVTPKANNATLHVALKRGKRR